jgi:DNA-binding NtrC family response regulator
LNVFNIEIPPLRKRKEDIPFIAEYFVKKENPDMELAETVIQNLIEQEWKGNVRELDSVIKRSVIFAKAEGRTLVKLTDLPKEMGKIRKSDLESLILKSLRKRDFTRSSITETARELGDLSRTIISENLRGIIFKTLFENNFDTGSTIALIADSESEEISKNVRAKVETYTENLRSDIMKYKDKDFLSLKEIFASKYKNLPQKYHFYMDEMIKHFMKN